MKIEKDEITIRDFTETDIPLMFKWLTDKRVLEYYEGRDVRFTMDTLSAHFLELDKMQEIVTAFLDTKFVDLERRIRRVNRLDERNDYA